MGDLLDFYGRECGPCKRMAPLVERLEAEFGVKVERYEVWHDAKNQQMMMEVAEGRCMSVPFLFNRKTKDFICGEADYERLKKWAGVQG